jgi:FkbM family methyltransferase
MLGDRYNWQAIPRAFAVLPNPVELLWHAGRGTFPEQIQVRSPTGPLMIGLRNFESLKTCYSVFCREDYKTSPSRSFIALDLGANIGVAALYFLSRNRTNRVRCYEPDPTNLGLLRRNLEPFRERVEIVEKAVAPSGGAGTLFRATDGKHSSLRQDVAVYNGFAAEVPTELVAFDKVLRSVADERSEVLVKVDVEGIEQDLIRSVDFSDHPHVRRIVVESVGCSELISRPHRRTVRTGAIEDIEFI